MGLYKTQVFYSCIIETTTPSAMFSFIAKKAQKGPLALAAPALVMKPSAARSKWGLTLSGQSMPPLKRHC
jgi:hypothetical protein